MAKKLSAQEQKLQDRYLMAVKRREERMEAERPFRERAHAIFSAPRVIKTDFWCQKCKKDCSGVGFRRVCAIRQHAPVAWFAGVCPKGHNLVRYITDKEEDPYYGLSLMLAKQRYDMADDLLSPADPRFKEVYPEQWKEMQEKK